MPDWKKNTASGEKIGKNREDKMKDLLQWKMWFMVFGTFVDNQGKNYFKAAGKSGT